MPRKPYDYVLRTRWIDEKLVWIDRDAMEPVPVENLGGGAYGYLKFLPNHHLLVTNDDASLPTEGDRIVVGLYRGGLEEVEEEGAVGQDEVEQWMIDPEDFRSDAEQLSAFDDLINDIELEYGED